MEKITVLPLAIKYPYQSIPNANVSMGGSALVRHKEDITIAEIFEEKCNV